MKRVSLARLRRAAIDRLSDADVRWRSLGALYIAGGTMACVSLALPVDPGSRVLPVFLVGFSAILSGIGMIVAAARLPAGDRWLSGMLGVGTVLVTLVVGFNHSPASAYALMYVWVGFDGFFFLERRQAFGHLAWLGLNYAVVLALVPSHGLAEAGRWFAMMCTVGVIGALADVLRSRSDELIGRLSEAARTDSLTGLLNRRGFEERIEYELQRARRSGEPVTLVVGDLDHFKAINDRFGHHRGDEALRAFARLVATTKRVIDGAARIGGEEFALVLPDTDEHGAYLLAERLRRRVSQADAAAGLPTSVSFGIATYPGHAADPQDLLRNADQSLYLAKRLGRDRSVIYSREVATSWQDSEEGSSLDQLPAVLVLAETLDLRDTGTAQHSQTVGRYAETIAASLGLQPRRVHRIRLAGVLHDIGKIGVPDPILQKAGPLTDEEWAEMRKHPELGARILAGANLDDVAGWVLAHHERPDGRGYPHGLEHHEIPLEARILSVADAFEAMTSDRVYRTAMAFDDAVAELRRHAGTQFDLEIVETFIEVLGREALPA